MAVLLSALGALVMSLDASVNVAFPAMAQAFGVGPVAIRWVIICYVLTYAITSFVAGMLADRLGPARVFSAGLWVSLASFLAYLAASSFGVLLGLRVLQGIGELKLALTRQFAPTEFFANDVYIRAIVDLAVVRKNTALVIDYKTGKVKDDFTQLELASAVLSIFMPEIEQFKLSLLWLKEKTISTQERTKEELAGIWADLIKRSGAIESAIAATNFPPNPTPLCKGCPVAICPHQLPTR